MTRVLHFRIAGDRYTPKIGFNRNVIAPFFFGIDTSRSCIGTVFASVAPADVRVVAARSVTDDITPIHLAIVIRVAISKVSRSPRGERPVTRNMHHDVLDLAAAIPIVSVLPIRRYCDGHREQHCQHMTRPES